MKFIRYAGMLLGQLVCMLLCAYLLYNTIWLSRTLYAAAVWAILPVIGLLSAYMVTIKGVNNYLAWIAPPLAAVAAHYLAFFYMPSSPGPLLICALCAIVGAAAGDVKNKFERK